MRIALIAPPFICVPPQRYGGTELFIGQLAIGLGRRGLDVVVYTNGESAIEVEKRWLYAKPQWPLKGEVYDNLKDMNHSSWAVADAMRDCDIIHLNNLPGLFQRRFVERSFVYTLHHPHDEALSALYRQFPDVHYVTISDFQRRAETMPRVRTIHHGVDLSLYECREKKQDYFSFIGRIAPIKGTHTAIAIAQRTGIPLKIAGEVQPMYREYFDTAIKPHIDGRFIEYIGEAALAAKNELLGNSRALLFPVEWDEPFGLVMIEAMACGTPVLAFARGSVPEVVTDGVSGYICQGVDEMAARARTIAIPAMTVRGYAEENFAVERMVERYIALYEEILEDHGAAKEPQRAIA